MPCYDGGPSCNTSYEDEYLDEKKAKERTEAMLCAILMVLENQVEGGLDAINMIDYKEAGFKRKDLEVWWTEHKELDRKRRIREEKARNAAKGIAEKKARMEAARKAALAKLSPEDRKALGLK